MSRTLSRCFALVLLALLTSSGLHGQELQSFDLGDFLNPQLLWVEGENGERQGAGFFTSRWLVGFIDNYQRRNQITDTGFLFGRASASLFFGMNQLNVEATSFDCNGRDSENIGELRFELGRYFLAKIPEEDTLPARILVSWRTTSGEETGFEDEVSLSFDVALPVPGESGEQIYGGWVVSYVPSSGDYHLSYRFRNRAHRWSNGIALDTGIGFGAEHVEESLRWGHTRLELSLVLPVPLFNSYLHLVAAPYYHPHPSEGSDSFDTEFGAFLDASALSRLFRVKAH